ncbi:MAG: hypothetical protein JWR88_231, partial [Pseudonocardia sp.]|nr:hypothetical protein [Pseudonocardia sp.]
MHPQAVPAELGEAVGADPGGPEMSRDLETLLDRMPST